MKGKGKAPKKTATKEQAVTPPVDLPVADPPSPLPPPGSIEAQYPHTPRPHPYKPETQTDWQEEYDERAAIIHYEGGHTEKYADIQARQQVGEPPKKEVP